MSLAKLSETCNKCMLVLFTLCCILLTISYYDSSKLLNQQLVFTSNRRTNLVSAKMNRTEESDKLDTLAENEQSFRNNNEKAEETYLVSSSKCNIVNLSPFSRDAKKYFKPLEYKNCTDKNLLTHVIKRDNIAKVCIDKKVIAQYTKSPISCWYADVARSVSAENRDDYIILSDFKEFNDNVTITQEAISIRCNEKDSKKQIYENVHTSIRITEEVQRKINYYNSGIDSSTGDSIIKPLSVLFIGIDSISRLNFIRALPKTYRYIEENGWMSLNGYNKIDDNTYPNLMAILTGFNGSASFKVCNPRMVGILNKCPMIWYNYRDLNYVTGYAEDEATISTFNYLKKGFLEPPTDYYFRPYIMATQKLSEITVKSMAYCTGPQTTGERMFDLVKDFGVTFKETPNFGFFWMNSFSHNDVSAPSMMDDKIKEFLTDLENSGVTNNSLIIFLSDHGIRFGDIRLTLTGWLEERLPFIYFSFPPWFKDRFPNEYRNFKNNKNKLTTPYDLHMTLQHVLTISGLNYTIKPSDACPKCVSLFEEVPEDRSCEDARITEHWCTCAGYSESRLDPPAEQKVSDFVVDYINKIVSDRLEMGGDKCLKYSSEEITTRITNKFSYKKTSYVLVTLKTHPKAIFETTVRYTGNIMNSTLHAGVVSRLDLYSPHSKCVDNAYLKKYCYCA